MKKNILIFCLLSYPILGFSQKLEKLTSIAYYGYNGLNPRNLTVFKDKLYFFGTNDNKLVDMLMVYNDATNTTSRVKQIDTFKKFTGLSNLTVFGNLLIFSQDITGELWVSDGTTGGTNKIKDIKVGIASGFAIMNGKAYFAGIDPTKPGIDQLWETDGTTNGTKLVKTINPSGAAAISSLMAWNGHIYFGATDGTNKKQVWQSDGTSNGTILLKIINPTGDANPLYFLPFNGKLYFNATVKGYATQIFETDGTLLGTKQFTYINSTYSSGLNPGNFIIYNNNLFFTGYDTSFFSQLWKTDGTVLGTVKVKWNYLNTGIKGLNPTSLCVFKGLLYFCGYDSVLSSQQLWVSDGTTTGTQLVTKYGYNFGPSKITPLGNFLAMVAGDSASKKAQVFASDGTMAGTVMPKVPDDWSTAPLYPIENFVQYHNALYYRGAYAVFSDYQLCRFSEFALAVKDVKTPALGIYPNPVSQTLHLKNIQKPMGYSISTLTGSIILNGKLNTPEENIDVSALSAGMYIITFENKAYQALKFSKQ